MAVYFGLFFWSPAGGRNGTYEITSVRPSACYSFFSKTARTIFLKFGMKLPWDKCEKLTFLFFAKKFLIRD